MTAIPYVVTAAGRALPLLNPKPADIDFRAGAEQLAKQPRFAGATPDHFYSVAQHCVLVSRLAHELGARLGCDRRRDLAGLWGLLHDLHEAWTGDATTPLRQAFIKVCGQDPLQPIQAGLDAAIAGAAGCPWPLPADVLAIVREADLVALATEKRDLMHADGIFVDRLPNPSPRRITAQRWDQAQDSFWTALVRQCPAVQVRPMGGITLAAIGS